MATTTTLETIANVAITAQTGNASGRTLRRIHCLACGAKSDLNALTTLPELRAQAEAHDCDAPRFCPF